MPRIDEQYFILHIAIVTNDHYWPAVTRQTTTCTDYASFFFHAQKFIIHYCVIGIVILV